MIKLSNLIAPHFKDAHSHIKGDNFSEYWLSGGRGSTKTSFTCIEIITGMIKNPDYNAVCIRKTKASLQDSCYAELIKAINRLGLGEYFQYKVSPLEIIYLPTGQTIKFRGLDDPEKIKGLSFVKGIPKFIWFEELAEFRNMDEIRSAQQTLERGSQDNFVTFFTYNPPKNRNSWVNAEAERDPYYRYTHHSDYRTVPVDWLGDSFISRAEEMRTNKPEIYNHEYLGIATGNDELLVFNGYYEVRDFETPEDISKTQNGRFYFGADWGFSPDPTTLIRCFIDDNCLFIDEEFYKEGVEVDHIKNNFLKIDHASRYPIYADCARPELISYVKRQGLNIQPAKKWKGSVEDGIDYMRSKFRKIVVHPRCRNTAHEFSMYRHKVDKQTGEKLPDIEDKDNHCIDAIRYALHLLIKQVQFRVRRL